MAFGILAFNRGRISRLALARTDFARTQFSAEIQTNWMPRALGSMMLREVALYRSNSDYVVGYVPGRGAVNVD